MAAADADRELTSTLHLGLRSVVGTSPSTLIEDFYNQASEEEKSVIDSALSSTGENAMIFIHRGAQKGSRFLVTPEGVTIGRAPESSIFLNDVTVSRKHASIERTGAGFTFRDSGSLNGSYVNNESVAEKKLVTGDEIQIGKFHLLFIGSINHGGEVS
jgi:pSer/pThr/pTyr-binding forkhead associated (FHA) protein